MRVETETHCLELRVWAGKESRPLWKGLSRKKKQKGEGLQGERKDGKGKMGGGDEGEGRGSKRKKGRKGEGGSEMESSRTSLSHFSLPLPSPIYSPPASSCH